jgi:YbgC/YbaW family acyl-CoA thioester hydrolase
MTSPTGTTQAEAPSTKTTDRASIVVQRRIEWPDTDASGHWHNTAAFRFVEVAETALLEKLGILQAIYGRLPRVQIEAEFKRLLSFRDIVDLHLSVARVGNSSVTYAFEIRKAGDLYARAKVVAVLLDESGQSTKWEPEHKRLLLEGGPQPAELLSEGDPS